MVKIMENPIKMDDLGGKPTIFGETAIYDRELFSFSLLNLACLSKSLLSNSLDVNSFLKELGTNCFSLW